MSFSGLGDLNWLAVIVAAIAYFALGALWYAPPVFGKVWAEAGGIEMPEGERPPPSIFIMPLVGSLLSAVVLGLLADATGTDTIDEGVALGLAIAVGFAIPISIITAVFEANKPKQFVWGAVNGGYHVVGNLAAAIIIAAMA